ncbi:DUF4430 domain-containing protein [Aminipila terrae]|uniref:DUF4430 domain-containing protein n=2 Tax=Aminipila terrae TaxID=2697030 RepID=A0A6P1MP29_9FIRM|nr:DUF4430 domain-containing protein [Aminipila terrae]
MAIDPSTGKDKYQTDPVPDGKPVPVEPGSVSVTKNAKTCTMSIECKTILDNMNNLNKEKVELVPKDGVIMPATTVTFYEGESVFNLLQRETKKNKIHMEFSNTPIYNSAYIEGIHNLYEFDCGELSGWMYKVNGWFPNYGCSRYQIKQGDVIEWVYTCDLGRDVGADLMKNKCYADAFSSYHPFVNFLYFALVLFFSMVLMHPVCLTVSLIAAFWYSIYIKGKKAARFNFLILLPMLVVTAIINPAFNHAGITILTYLPNGNPLTLESILYGVAAATMLAAVICWFSCYNEVMTSDKFVYLFGRIIPALSLILSMILRFVPRFKAQIKVISNAQKCVGRDVSNGSVIQRAKNGITILSIMVTWALENAIETADSMRSRGYGLPGRTAFSIFHLDSRDKKALAAIAGLGLCVLAGQIFGILYFRYYPSMKGNPLEIFSYFPFIAYAGLCIVPIIINEQEKRQWTATQLNS